MSLQDIKDTFYTTLRDRIASVNPGRTIVVRGTIRPAIFVNENELATASTHPDAFSLNWNALDIDPLGMAKLTCAIHYATPGTPGAAGMDRGRALAALDAELRTTLCAAPQSALRTAFTEVQGGGASTQTAAGTSIFWTDPLFSPAAQLNEQLERTANVEVFGYE